MNSLGRDPQACIEVLDTYLDSVRALEAALGAEPSAVRSPGIASALRRLEFQLSVDALAREGAQARLRMTPCEARILAPALADVMRDVERVDREADAGARMRLLSRARQSLESALRRIERLDARCRRERPAAATAG
ncbi:MAG: hypothetical protein JSR54_13755 [Proteobacteria bacterium]|nr:hypothetical protein [Pseudomonadota bacterium]